jgi:hypothetical protein
MKYEPQTTNLEERNKRNKKYKILTPNMELKIRDMYFKYGARTTLYKIRTPNKELEILNTKYNSPNYEL